MSFFEKRSGKIVLALFSLLLICYIALVIILNLTLPKRVGEVVSKLNNNPHYTVDVDGINVDPLLRLKGSEVRVGSKSDPQRTLIKLNGANVDLFILGSLFTQKVILDDIIIESSEISASKQDLLDFFSYIKAQESDSTKDHSVLVKHVQLNQSTIKINENESIKVPLLDIELSQDKTLGAIRIRIASDWDISNTGFAIDGEIQTQQGNTNGTFTVESEELTVNIPLPNTAPRARVVLGSEIGFEYTDKFSSQGRIGLSTNSEQKEGSRAELVTLDYNIIYDHLSDRLDIDQLVFNLVDIADLEFSGYVDKLRDSRELNLAGKASTSDLSNIKNLISDNSDLELTGSLQLDDLTVNGSEKNKNIVLKGSSILRDFSISNNNSNYQLSNLDCDLGIEKNIYSEQKDSTLSRGKCSASDLDIKNLLIRDITTDINLSASKDFSQITIDLNRFNSSLFGGTAGGNITFSSNKETLTYNGSVTGKNISLDKAREKLVPIDISGILDTIKMRFSGDNHKFTSKVNFIAHDFRHKMKRGNSVEITNAYTDEPVDLTYVIKHSETLDGDKQAETKFITIGGENLNYETLRFSGMSITKGTIKSLNYVLDRDKKWRLVMSSVGEGFSDPEKGVFLSRFNERLNIDQSGKDGFFGEVTGEDGRYRSITFPNVYGKYKYKDELLELSELRADIGTFGKFTSDDMSIKYGSKSSGTPYDIRFDSGTFTAMDDKVVLKEIGGEFKLFTADTRKSSWNGSITSKNATIASVPITDIKARIKPTPGGISIEDLSGKVLQGKLAGNADLATDQSPPGLDTYITLSNVAVNPKIDAGNTRFNFKGTVPYGELPQGNYSLNMSNIKLTGESASKTISATISGSSKNETITIDSGLIRGEGNSLIKFKGNLMDLLTDNKKAEFNSSNIPIDAAVNTLGPLLPNTITQSKLSGTLDIDLYVNDPFGTRKISGGSLVIRNGSFGGKLADTNLRIKGMNGELTLRDNYEPDKVLGSLLGTNLNLNKKIYREYLDTMKSHRTTSDADTLSIEQLEYGFLKFENLECELELDHDTLNIKQARSKLFRGQMFLRGNYQIGKSPSDYNLTFLLNKVSLEAISQRLPSMQGYITGRVNGLFWLSGKGSDLSSVDGPFKFWSIKSKKEPNKIGKALLEKLGARERMFLGSTRNYDTGKISGYIKNGVITFKVIDISNSFLGIKDLQIRVDSRLNSISIAHFLSVIREIARRSQAGGPTIETN